MELVYRSNKAPLIYLIIEYSVDKWKGLLSGKIFYMFRYSGDKDPYSFKGTVPLGTKEDDENIERIIDDHKGYFIKNILNKVLPTPKVPDHFTQINIKEFNPIRYNKETYEYLTDKIDSIKIKEQLTKAKQFPKK